MEKSLVPFIKAIMFGIATVAVIPRQYYKKFFIYGFIFGAIGDGVFVLILGHGFHLFKYYGMGPFSVYGLFPFWTPVAWMFAFMLFFYFLPVRKIFLSLHILGFAFFGYFVGVVLEGFGVFQYIGFWRYIAPLFFVLWFSLAAWVYMRNEKISLK
ncbi:MAG: hypothetical protein ACYC21_03935 [Eubacteriales bacterium]